MKSTWQEIVEKSYLSGFVFLYSFFFRNEDRDLLFWMAWAMLLAVAGFVTYLLV
jgi:hypothetical protein